MTRRRKKTPEPEPQYVTTSGWQLARLRGIDHAYAVLFRGQYVGWVIPTSQGWYWRGSAGIGSTTSTSKSFYRTWALAAAKLTRTQDGLRVAGRDHAARAGDFRPFALLTESPWEPTIEPSKPDNSD